MPGRSGRAEWAMRVRRGAEAGRRGSPPPGDAVRDRQAREPYSESSGVDRDARGSAGPRRGRRAVASHGLGGVRRAEARKPPLFHGFGEETGEEASV